MYSKLTLEGELLEVKIVWSEKYACPIYVLPDGRRYIGETGEYAGYFDEIDNPPDSKDKL